MLAGIHNAGWRGKGDSIQKEFYSSRGYATHSYGAMPPSTGGVSVWDEHIQKKGPVTDERQDVRLKSKSIFVNNLQANIERYKNNEELVPLVFCLDNKAENFVADRQRPVDKDNKGFSDVEIRMAYKLCCEHPDPEIRALAQKTIQFQEGVRSSNGTVAFQDIPPPWSGQEAVWAERERTGEQAAYSQRLPEDNPAWLHKLSDLLRHDLGEGWRLAPSSVTGGCCGRQRTGAGLRRREEASKERVSDG